MREELRALELKMLGGHALTPEELQRQTALSVQVRVYVLVCACARAVSAVYAVYAVSRYGRR